MSARAAAVAASIVAVVAAAALAARARTDATDRCGSGFTARGPRCCPVAATLEGDVCSLPFASQCPAPLVRVEGGCDAPLLRARVPATELLVGPSDWEAEGRVPARTVRAKAFRIDVFEATVGRVCARGPCLFPRERAAGDLARAARLPYRDAAAVCALDGGRLPTADEWLVATASPRPASPGSAPSGRATDEPRLPHATRYPWGETGAVCRRAAWGLAVGPCGNFGPQVGSDTVGAHAAGVSAAYGLHDAAGNAAEWSTERVTPEPYVSAERRVSKGGSVASAAAQALRSWSEEPAGEAAGFRCVYDD